MSRGTIIALSLAAVLVVVVVAGFFVKARIDEDRRKCEAFNTWAPVFGNAKKSC